MFNPFPNITDPIQFIVWLLHNWAILAVYASWTKYNRP